MPKLFTDRDLKIEKNLETALIVFLIKQKNEITYPLGDFNLNLVDYETNVKLNLIVMQLFSRNFIAIINKATRVTNYYASIINYILTNLKRNVN